MGAGLAPESGGGGRHWAVSHRTRPHPPWGGRETPPPTSPSGTRGLARRAGRVPLGGLEGRAAAAVAAPLGKRDSVPRPRSPVSVPRPRQASAAGLPPNTQSPRPRWQGPAASGRVALRDRGSPFEKACRAPRGLRLHACAGPTRSHLPRAGRGLGTGTALRRPSAGCSGGRGTPERGDPFSPGGEPGGGARPGEHVELEAPPPSLQAAGLQGSQSAWSACPCGRWALACPDVRSPSIPKPGMGGLVRRPAAAEARTATLVDRGKGVTSSRPGWRPECAPEPAIGSALPRTFPLGLFGRLLSGILPPFHATSGVKPQLLKPWCPLLPEPWEVRSCWRHNAPLRSDPCAQIPAWFHAWRWAQSLPRPACPGPQGLRPKPSGSEASGLGTGREDGPSVATVVPPQLLSLSPLALHFRPDSRGC